MAEKTRLVNKQMNRSTNKWTDEWTNRSTDEWTDEQMDRQTAGLTYREQPVTCSILRTGNVYLFIRWEGRIIRSYLKTIKKIRAKFKQWTIEYIFERNMLLRRKEIQLVS